jgi:hypothetical protein
VTGITSTLYEAVLDERSRMWMRISHFMRLKSSLHPRIIFGETPELGAERLKVSDYDIWFDDPIVNRQFFSEFFLAQSNKQALGSARLHCSFLSGSATRVWRYADR